MNREELYSKDFLYDLPEKQIAKYPLADRNTSKLLIYKQGEIRDDVFTNLDQHLPVDSTLIFNDTKVIAARLLFTKHSGANIEIFCLEPFNTNVEQALNSTNTCMWKCMVRNLRKFNKGDVLELNIAGTILKATIYESKWRRYEVINFEWEGGISFSSILDKAGKVPIPPYLNRPSEEEDKKNYQTVYAKNEGAVAAPTGGLHFVPDQLKQLKKIGHSLEYLTLFVGAGTFKTILSEKLVEHKMHHERIVIDKATIERLAHHQKPIIAVGTTSLRSLESLYWLAVKMNSTKSDQILNVMQDDAYEFTSDWNFNQACTFLVDHLTKNGMENVDFFSGLFIMPSYEWKAIDGLITNFHQPGSTLLTLIASWIGADWKKIYTYALKHDFRFLSYGDSSLLLK